MGLNHRDLLHTSCPTEKSRSAAYSCTCPDDVVNLVAYSRTRCPDFGFTAYSKESCKCNRQTITPSSKKEKTKRCGAVPLDPRRASAGLPPARHSRNGDRLFTRRTGASSGLETGVKSRYRPWSHSCPSHQHACGPVGQLQGGERELPPPSKPLLLVTSELLPTPMQ